MPEADDLLQLCIGNLIAGCAESGDDRKYLSGFVLHCVRITFALRSLAREANVVSPCACAAALCALNVKAHSSITRDEISQWHRGESLDAEIEYIRSMGGPRGPAAAALPLGPPALPQIDLSSVMESFRGMETLSRSIKQDTEQIYTHMTLDTLAATEAEKAVITDQLKKLKTMLLDEWDTDEDIEEWVAGGLLSELGGACVATQMGLSDLYQITQMGQPTQVSLSSVGLPMYLRGFYSIDASEGREPFSLLMKWMQAGIPSEQLCSLISTAVGFNTLGSLDMNEPIDWCVKPCVETEHRRWFQFHINFKGSEHPVRFLLKCLHVQVCLNAMGLLVHELINKDLLMCGTRAWSYLGADSVFSNAIFEKLTLLIEKDGGGNGTSLEAEKWVFVCRLFVFLRLNQGAGFDYQLPIGKQSFLLGGDIDIYRQLEACLTHQLQLFLDPSHMCPVPSDVERRFLRALDELYPVPPAP